MGYTGLEQNFFGRTETLELLHRRVVDLKDGYRQNIALIGNQYMGKSSILRHFVENLDDKDLTVIYLDLENKDFGYFFAKFTGSLLYNYCRNHNLPVHDDLNVLIESVKDSIPHSVDVIRKIQMDIQAGNLSDAYLGLLTLPEVFTNETGKFCLLILDEFHNLEEFVLPNVFQELGKKIMTQKRCFYIFSSSYRQVAQKILSEKLSLLFGNFEIIEVNPFDLQSSQDFVGHNLRDYKIGVQLSSFLIDFTGGHPLYLNLICNELINLSAIHKQSEIYMPLLSQAVENTIFNRWGVLSRHFELIISDLCNGKGNRVTSSILQALANGHNKVDDIQPLVGIKKSPLSQKLNRLIEAGIVIKNGRFHYIQDKLFKYWITYVYQRRLKAVEMTADKEQKEFKEEFNRSIDQFKMTSRKDFSSRIVELLYCFDNGAFDLNGRRYKLPVFQEIQPSKIRVDSGVYFDVIKAATDEGMWFIVLKKDNFGEGDVGTVIAESKKIAERPERCVIISMSDLDENARVKALQERIWIWNEGELNTLLNLFDQPYIV